MFVTPPRRIVPDVSWEPLKIHSGMIPHWLARLVWVLKIQDNNAGVAGGYLRDIYHEVKPKDIDIFVNVAYHNAVWNSKAVQRTHPRLVRVYKDNPYKTWDPTIVTVEIWESNGPEPPINMIYVSDVIMLHDRIRERFDFGICQICFDGVAVKMTPFFHVDAAHKTFTIINQINLDCSIQRFDRIKKRYPGWTLEY